MATVNFDLLFTAAEQQQQPASRPQRKVLAETPLNRGLQQPPGGAGGDLKRRAIANNITNRLGPSKERRVVPLRPESTPQLGRRNAAVGLVRSNSMRDSTELMRRGNKVRVPKFCKLFPLR